MRKLFIFITIIFFAEVVSGQTPTLQQPADIGGYVNPNPSAYGTVSQSIMIWKQFGIPTGDGAPTGTQKADLHLSLLYFDSTNNVLYNYSPSTHAWSIASSNPYPITFAYNSSNDSLVLTLSDGTRFPVTIIGGPITDDSTAINYNWTGDTITRVPYAYQLDSAFGLVSANPNPDGAFATRANYVFQRIGPDTTFSDYQFFYPDTANTFYDKSQEIVYTWNGAAWVPSPKSWLDILNRDKKALNGGTYFYYDVILKTNHIQRIRIGKDGRVWIYNLAHDGDDSSWTIGVTKAGLLYAKELKDLVLTHDGDCATGATLVGDTLNIPICSGGGGGGTVESVTGNPSGLVDNTDPANPIVQQDASKLNITDTSIINAEIVQLRSGKQNNLTLTTTGTSGAATLVGSTLNIPNYATGGGGGLDTSSMINPNMFTGSDYSRLQQATDYARIRNKLIYIGWNNGRNSRLWLLDTAVLFQSHCNYILSGCTIQRSDSSHDNIFRSANIGYGLTNPLATAYTNVSFIGYGAIIKGADNPTSSGDAYQTLSTTTTFANGFSFGTWANMLGRSHKGGWFNNLIQICNVSDIKISGITVVNPNAYGITLGYCSYVSAEKIHSQNLGYANGDTTHIMHNQGTLDFHQSWNNIIVKDVDGFSQDDVIAFNTLNKDSTAGHYGYYPEGDTISSVINTNILVSNVHAGSNNNVIRFILPPGSFFAKDIRVNDVTNTLKTTDPYYGSAGNGTFASVITLGENQGSGIGGNISWGQWDNIVFDNIQTRNSTYLIQVKNRVQNSRFTNLYKPNALATSTIAKTGSFADLKNVWSSRIDSSRITLASISGVDRLAVDSLPVLYTTEYGGSAMKLAQWYTDKAVSFGKSSLLNNTTGGQNTAFGSYTLQANVTGNFNTAMGYNAGFSSINGYLTAIGYAAGYNTNSGQQNVFVGHQAGYSNTGGNDNVAVGYLSSYTSSGGSGNVGIGSQTNYSNTGSFNVAVGHQALRNQGNASYNVGVGYFALNGNSTGADNVAIGPNAIKNNTSGSFNVGIGESPLISNSTGHDNIAILNSLANNTTGAYNISMGTGSSSQLTTTNGNIAIGFRSNFTGTGTGNTALGDSAGYNNGTGSYNTSIGSNSGAAVSTNFSNTIAIGYKAQPTASNQTRIGNASTTDTYLGGTTQLHLTLGTPPATSTSTGVAGTIIFGTDGNMYLCTATNTWVKFTSATF